MAKIQKLTTIVWQECRATGVCLHSLLMGVQNATLETVFYKEPAIMCLGIYPSDLKKICLHKNLSLMSLTLLFLFAKNYNLQDVL